MVEFFKIVELKELAARVVSGKREVTQEEVDALVANLESRGIIDEKGLVRG